MQKKLFLTFPRFFILKVSYSIRKIIMYFKKPLNLSIRCSETCINTGDVEHERFGQPLTKPLNNLSCDFNNYKI